MRPRALHRRDTCSVRVGSGARHGRRPNRDCGMTPITYDDFAKVDIRVGRIVQVDEFPKARKPSYRLRIDFRQLGVQSSSAQITKYYDTADLVGKLVLAALNLPPPRNANLFPRETTVADGLRDAAVLLAHPEREV